MGVEVHHVTKLQLIIYVLHKCGFACSTKEVKKMERNATWADILDLEFNYKIGIQSSLYASDNDVVQTEKLNWKSTFHSTCQIFSVIMPDHSAQSSFGKTIKRKEVNCATILQDRIDIRPFKKTKMDGTISHC